MKTTPSPGFRHRIAPKGLSLVELLVVITIIVVLAALGTVGVLRMKSTARGTTCVSNLRQVGVAMLSYAVDKNGQLPPLEDRTGSGDSLRGIWTQIIADGGYLPRVLNSAGKNSCGAGVWACPDCTIIQNNYQGFGAAEGTVMKVMKGSVPGSGSVRIATIPRPERTWLVGDTANSSKDIKTGWYAIWANPASWSGSHVPAARHGGKVNVCMVDGHVESLTMKDLLSPEKDYTMFK